MIASPPLLSRRDNDEKVTLHDVSIRELSNRLRKSVWEERGDEGEMRK